MLRKTVIKKVTFDSIENAEIAFTKFIVDKFGEPRRFGDQLIFHVSNQYLNVESVVRFFEQLNEWYCPYASVEQQQHVAKIDFRFDMLGYGVHVEDVDRVFNCFIAGFQQLSATISI